MEVDKLINCKNCGAVLNTDTEQTIQCKYCGTVYHKKQQENSIKIFTGPETTTFDAHRQWEAPKNVKPKRKINPVGWVMVSLTFVFAIAALITKEQADKDQAQAALSDTVTIDTSMRFDLPQPTELAQTEQASLRKLAMINVDRPLFNKLYKNAKVSRLTYAKQETNVDDKNSIFKHKVNGLYININYSDSEYLLSFGCQYGGKKALDLQSVTFIIDNKHLHYKPVFLGGTMEGQAMAYSYEKIHDDDIPMLLSLATADKVIIHFKGKNGNDQMTLSKDQQDVLKRQLQLYKGLLLGYAKQ